MAVKASASITVALERDVSGIWRFYKIASSTSPPSAPTDAQGIAYIKNGTAITGWSTAEPAYDGTSTNSLYTCDLTGFTDGTVSWTPVSKSSSYEAAKQAYNLANTANGNAAAALEQSVEYIIGTQTAATNVWTGVTKDASIKAGKTIAYYLPFAGNSSAATLNLTLSGGGTTGAKNIRINNSNVTTHYPQYSVIKMTYDGTYWKTDNYNSDTTNRTRMQNVIYAAAAITAGRIICGTASGYRNIGASVAFDLAYPLLYAGTTLAAAATGDNNYLQINGVNASSNGTITSGANYKNLYLKGTISGNTFTIAASPFMTTVVPTSDDGYCYIPLGVFYNSTTNIYFNSSSQVYKYKDGAFGPVSIREASAAAKTATNFLTETTSNGLMVHPSTDSTTGWRIKDALELLVSGVSHIWAGIQSSVALVRVGLSTAGNVIMSGDGYVDIRNKSTVMAHFGYGSGGAISGTDSAPYYTLGMRASDTESTRGNFSVAEGYSVTAKGFAAHAEGRGTNAQLKYAHAEGYLTHANADCSHAEGTETYAEGAASHAEGADNTAGGNMAHAEGRNNTASADYAHVEGGGVQAANGNTASALAAHAEGSETVAGGKYSHAQNLGTQAYYQAQTAMGTYNSPGTSNEYALMIGNGTASARSNALVVDWNGNVIGQGMAGIIQMFGGTNIPSGWLECNGAAVSRTTYAKLYSAIGTTWGTGDGSTTFNLPDLRGRAPIGAGTGSGLTARTLGTKNIGTEDAIIPYHRHSVSAVSGGITGGSHNHNMRRTQSATATSGSNRYFASGSVESGFTTSSETHTHNLPAHDTNYAGTSGNTEGANMQPSAVVKFIICTGKTS